MSQHSIAYDLTREYDDETVTLDLDVEYDISRFYTARTYGPPEDCEPAHGGEVSGIVARCGREVFMLTDVEELALEQWIVEHHEGDDE